MTKEKSIQTNLKDASKAFTRKILFIHPRTIKAKRMQIFDFSSSDSPIFPTASQIAKLRLILSTYQDGTGQLAAPNGMTRPGWRDFERAVAAAFDGQAQESKHVFDVIVTPSNSTDTYGISCKMRRELTEYSLI